MIKTKRIYEKHSSGDGYRILIDRLWPRGVLKNNARIDLWLKEIAPTDQLRKWFSHDPKKWNIFKKKYIKELSKNKYTVDKIKNLKNEYDTITLVFAAKDEQHNNAVVLVEFLDTL
jgi:uncharacterized protein YeaO (DUF488 family)